MSSTVPGAKDTAGHNSQPFPLRGVWEGDKQVNCSAGHGANTQDGEKVGMVMKGSLRKGE